MTARAGALLWIASAVCYFVAEAVAAAALDTYGYATDYVSTLGDPQRSPHAAVMNAAFVTQALAFPARRVAGVPGRAQRAGPGCSCRSRCAMASAICLSPSCTADRVRRCTVSARLWPSSAETRRCWPDHRSFGRHSPHRRTALVSIALGVFGLLCLLAVAYELPPIGAWERGSVYAIYAWQVVTAVLLLARGRGGTHL